MYHVVPLNDIIEHEDSSTCQCCPTIVIKDGEMICIHNAMDNREDLEGLNPREMTEKETIEAYSQYLSKQFVLYLKGKATHGQMVDFYHKCISDLTKKMKSNEPN